MIRVDWESILWVTGIITAAVAWNYAVYRWWKHGAESWVRSSKRIQQRFTETELRRYQEQNRNN